jgi:radical SAM superfamily enzyme YgiQ (UPF0313 family)
MKENKKMQLSSNKKIKEYNNKIIIVFGGPYVTGSGEKIPEYVDFVIRGHGCVPIVQIAEFVFKGKKIDKSIKGIYSNNYDVSNDSIFYDIPENEPLPDYSDLDILKYKVNLNKSYLKENKEVIIYPYRLSYGCTLKCSFCTYHHYNRYKGYKSIDKIIFELETIKKTYDNVFFRFIDDSLNNDPEAIMVILDKIIEKSINIQWWAFVHIKDTGTEIIDKFAAAGCKMIFWGVEHFSQNMINNFKKGFNINEFFPILEYASKKKLLSHISVILNAPGENNEDLHILKKGILRTLKINHVYMKVNQYWHMTQSSFYQFPSRYNIINIDNGIDVGGELVFWIRNGESEQEFISKWLEHKKVMLEMILFCNLCAIRQFYKLTFIPIEVVLLVNKIITLYRRIKSKIQKIANSSI